MRRALVITGVLAAVVGFLFVTTGASDDQTSGDYRVRAVFDDAAYAIQGEDVKVAGVKVGKITALEVTKDKKAAVTLTITQPGFKDFRDDASCTIRPQSLIGEKYVECTPTVPKAPGEKPSARLKRIPDGQSGAGQFDLPVKNTSSPVDVDLIGDITRLPQRQRLSLIIAELGTGLAGNGPELRQVIRRANPALQQLDKVLQILADENQTLADLARDSDTVISPLARDRDRIESFIGRAQTVATATAERGQDLEGNLRRLPRFLNQLRPTVRRLGDLSDQATPVLTDLGAQAPAINRVVVALKPFSEQAGPALKTLGAAARVGRPAVIAARPIVRQLLTFSREAKPVGKNLAALLTSFRDTGGIERLMDYIFYQVSAINGFDTFGHYLRAGLIVNQCATYAVAPVTGCNSNFSTGATGATSAVAAARESGDPSLVRVAKMIAGEPIGPGRDGGANTEAGGGTSASSGGAAAPAGGSGTTSTRAPSVPGAGGGTAAPAGGSGATGGSGASAGTPAAPASTPAAPPGAQKSTGNPLLDYLLGGGKK